MKQLAIAVLLLTTPFAKGQEVVFGDTAVIRDIQGKCSIIYDTRDKTDFLLTQTRLPKNASSGSNLVVYSNKGLVNRIVLSTTTKEGTLAIELYYWDGNLAMIYETLEYYQEQSPAGQIKNFKGLPYWESRFYFRGKKLIAHKHSGRRMIGNNYTGKPEIEDSERIREFVNAHIRQ